MALVAVSSAINSTLVPLLSGEVKLLWNIHTEVASIKAELESLTSFLKDADSSPKLENERAKNWVKQVRELAYQIEDVMDEYILHLAENRQRRGFIGFLRKLARSITKLKPQHDIASQIQDIKMNIGEIKKRADRYGFSSLELGSSTKTEEKVHDDPRVASLFIEEDEVVGIESTREELIHRLLIRESNRTVTALVGERRSRDSEKINNCSRQQQQIDDRSRYQLKETKLDVRIKRCEVHDVIHEIVLAKCDELSFCQILGEANRSWNNETQRWSMLLRNMTNKDLKTMSSTKSRIRSIFAFSVGELPKQQLLGTLAGNFKLLKVLDLQGARLDQLHEEVGNLLHLRYISVKGTEVKIVLKSIGNLHNLQTLNLKDSQVSMLQIGILSRLRNLRHLIGNYAVVIQGGIGHLEELQTLQNIEANDDLIKELENLRQLKKLLKNLVSLNLSGSGLTGAYAIKALQALPNLIELNFFNGYDGEQLYFDVGGSLKLKSLYLGHLKGLNSVTIEEGGLPVLKELQIEFCPQLKEVPIGIRNLRELKSLVFWGTPTGFLDRMQPDKGQDYWVIEHIPNVQLLWVELKWHTPREFQDARVSQRLNDEPQEVRGVEQCSEQPCNN
ncbi:hypothetical protein RHSIM_Rhsim02G0077900 [Rhododendron simsii]|uniref:Rx N-terminal domain-containing protein n=1 Tax=Rhododendron simsii TaxID=118357 RepID=A0A834HCP9_RHOSS|nr:hypothetical protein RHSIM_Rhsim02G0077900 [Rhododendron simsii]